MAESASREDIERELQETRDDLACTVDAIGDKIDGAKGNAKKGAIVAGVVGVAVLALVLIRRRS